MHIIIIAILFIYAALVVYALYGWCKKTKNEEILSQENLLLKFENELPTISIIVVLRNEEQQIPLLISSLKSLDYSEQLLEIIIVDDHSTDNSFEQLQTLTKANSQFTILQCPSEIAGKKQVLAWAITHTHNNYMLFTDADCELPSTWVLAYVEQIFQHKSSHFFFGLVNHSKEKNFLQQWFSLDFLSIVAMQGGLAKVQKAFSCNAANMCISREFALNQYETNSIYASGDDVFLLHKAKRIDNKAVVFVQSTNAMVTTTAPQTIKQFINQRVRWASKTSGYTDYWTLFVAGIVYATSFCVLFSAVLSIYSWQNETVGLLARNIFFVAFGIKTSIDLLFFGITLRTFQKQKLLPQVLAFQVFYTIYIVLIPIFALCFPKSWKGRKIT